MGILWKRKENCDTAAVKQNLELAAVASLPVQTSLLVSGSASQLLPWGWGSATLPSLLQRCSPYRAHFVVCRMVLALEAQGNHEGGAGAWLR